MIVHHGINGYVHEPEDIKAIAKSVVKLIKDRELNLQFSRASYDILKNSYSKSKHLELLKKLYDSLGD
ncbi:hypothetical protein NBRC111894_1765 [Sporolactobacillus inulinus]|uniref:Glycosyltransferase n=2 Tax=Sporolactobacillus inulinus TaxID=2078 RepID=A0A4Y1ZBC2_9BACL|nr:hypothetical protein NBRC111894_1765 [Sporolactobacillus inulinus]